jgi:putative oxidoreductase
MLLNSQAVHEDIGRLFLRIGVAGTMLVHHGWPKLMGFSERIDTFSDPLGIGPGPSFILILIAEVICSALIVLGLWTRLTTIPPIIAMAVVVFIVKADGPFKELELPFLFLVGFIAILLVGSGRYSLDRVSFR